MKRAIAISLLSISVDGDLEFANWYFCWAPARADDTRTPVSFTASGSVLSKTVPFPLILIDESLAAYRSITSDWLGQLE